MRRTAITTMLCLGMPEHLVRKISGHSPMSKSFFRYVALAQSYQDKETAMVFDKLKEKTFYDYVKDSVPASALRRLVKTDESLAYVCD